MKKWMVAHVNNSVAASSEDVNMHRASILLCRNSQLTSSRMEATSSESEQDFDSRNVGRVNLSCNVGFAIALCSCTLIFLFRCQVVVAPEVVQYCFQTVLAPKRTLFLTGRQKQLILPLNQACYTKHASQLYGYCFAYSSEAEFDDELPVGPVHMIKPEIRESGHSR